MPPIPDRSPQLFPHSWSACRCASVNNGGQSALADRAFFIPARACVVRDATRGGEILNATTTLTPMKAVELVEAAGIDDARRIIADFAEAGLITSYALVTKTIDTRGAGTCVRGAIIPADLWRRVVLGGIADDVWSSGTVRLAGSDLVGGDPAVVMTGITFKLDSIKWLIAHHAGTLPARPRKRKATTPPQADEVQSVDQVAAAPRPRRTRDPAAIPAGALTATMEQTEAALGVSRGTVYNLIDRGRLVRVKETGLRSVIIEVASIRAFAAGQG